MRRVAVSWIEGLGDFWCLGVDVERQLNVKLHKQTKRGIRKRIAKIPVAKPTNEEFRSTAFRAKAIKKLLVREQRQSGGMNEGRALVVLRCSITMHPKGLIVDAFERIAPWSGASFAFLARVIGLKTQGFSDRAGINARMPDAQLTA
jgi:hypothetical protein